MEEEIGLEEILLGDRIIGKNIDLKKRITLRSNKSTSIDGRVALSVQGDTRWDGHSTGHAYNINSGASILVGNHLSRVVTLECMSKHCCKYKLSLDHGTIFYPKNYDGSSKGIEAVGALRNRNIRKNGSKVIVLLVLM
jgi:hypothetical protein